MRPTFEQQSVVLSSAVSWLLYCVGTLGLWAGEEEGQGGSAEEGIVVNSGHVVALVSEIQPSSALTVSQYVE